MLPNRLLLAAAKKRSGPAQDPLTVLLMHMDGEDDGVIFSDSSITTPKGNATVTNDVVTKTAVKKWGTASAYFDGTDDKLSYTNHADYNFVGSTSQDYTIDFQVKFASHSLLEFFVHQYDTDDGVYQFTLSHNNGIGFTLYIKTANVARIVASGGEVTDTDWHHIAICKVTDGEGGVEWGVYKDSTQIIYGSDANTHSTSSDLYIGGDAAAAYDFEGHIDEYRIQKSNYFNAAPNVGLTDTIDVPTGPYS